MVAGPYCLFRTGPNGVELNAGCSGSSRLVDYFELDPIGVVEERRVIALDVVWELLRRLDLFKDVEAALSVYAVAVRVVLLANRVPVIRMRVPCHAPAAMDVAVVSPQEEVQGAGERRDERDVGERPAHEVVAALRRPMDQVVEADRDKHAARLPLQPRCTAEVRGAVALSLADLSGLVALSH